MPDKKRYACVFARWEENVVLVRKTHPDWQHGRLNGVGGECNEGEEPIAAAAREFTEETRIGAPDDLREFCVLEDSEVIVHFFVGSLPAQSDIASMLPSVNDKGEALELCEIAYHDFTDPDDVIDNLSWLIPMAFYDKYHIHASVQAYRRIRNDEDSPWEPAL